MENEDEDRDVRIPNIMAHPGMATPGSGWSW